MNEDDYTPPALETLTDAISDLVRAGFPPGRRAVVTYAAYRALHQYPGVTATGGHPNRLAVHAFLVGEEDRHLQLLRQLEADPAFVADRHRQQRLRALRAEQETHEQVRAFEVALAAFLIPWHPPEGSYADGVRGQIGWAMAQHLGTPSSLADRIRYWEERPVAEIAAELLADTSSGLEAATAQLERARKWVDAANARLAELEASLPEDPAP